MKPYEPSNKASILGLIKCCLNGIFGGVVIGIIAFIFSKGTYVAFLFPIGLVIWAGGLTISGTTVGKIRNPLIAAFLGGFVGLLICGTFWSINYYSTRADIREVIVQEYPTATEPVWDQAVDESLVELTGYSGFLGYLKLLADEGVSLGDLPWNQGFEAGSTLTWLYWLFELVLIVGACAYFAYSQAYEPFCEVCQTWYRDRVYAGGVALHNENLLTQTIYEGDFSKVDALIKENVMIPSIDVFVQDCECSNNESVLIMERPSTIKLGKSQGDVILTGLVSYEQRRMLSGAKNALEEAPKHDYRRTRIILVSIILFVFISLCLVVVLSSILS